MASIYYKHYRIKEWWFHKSQEVLKKLPHMGMAEAVNKSQGISYIIPHGTVNHKYAFHSSAAFDKLIRIDENQARWDFWIYSIQYYKHEFRNFFSFYKLYRSEIIILFV